MATILAVDDDPQVRDLLDTLLTEAGHQVVTAADGKEAMARFRAQPVAVVGADILMPEQDGFETIQQLHRIAPRVPVIAISGGGHNPAALYQGGGWHTSELDVHLRRWPQPGGSLPQDRHPLWRLPHPRKALPAHRPPRRGA